MDLLKAYSKILIEYQAALVFLGDGVLRSSLEAFVKANNFHNVYFTGFKNQTEMPELYALADILVLPSEIEPWGLVVNEAMCFGLPIIVSDKVGAGGNLVKSGVNGFIYSAGNIESLVSVLKILLADKNKMLDFGKASKELIKKWSYEEGINGILACLKMIKGIQ